MSISSNFHKEDQRSMKISDSLTLWFSSLMESLGKSGMQKSSKVLTTCFSALPNGVEGWAAKLTEDCHQHGLKSSFSSFSTWIQSGDPGDPGDLPMRTDRTGTTLKFMQQIRQSDREKLRTSCNLFDSVWFCGFSMIMVVASWIQG